MSKLESKKLGAPALYILLVVFTFLLTARLEICYQVVYPIILGGNSYSTTVKAVEIDDQYNILFGGNSAAENFMQTSMSAPFIGMLEMSGNFVWAKQLVFTETYSNPAVYKLRFNEEDSQVVAALDGSMGIIIVVLSVRDGSLVTNFYNDGTFGAYYNQGHQILIDSSNQVVIGYQTNTVCHLLKFTFNAKKKKTNLDWHLESECFEEGSNELDPMVLHQSLDPDYIFVGGRLKFEDTSYLTVSQIGKDDGKFSWSVYHEHYTDQSNAIDEIVTLSNYYLAVLTSNRIDDNEYVMGCSSSSSMAWLDDDEQSYSSIGQYLIIQRLIVDQNGEPISVYHFYLQLEQQQFNAGALEYRDLEELDVHPGKCLSIYSTDYQTGLVVWRSKSWFNLFYAELYFDEYRAVVYEIDMTGSDQNLIQGGFFQSSGDFIYFGKTQQLTGMSKYYSQYVGYIMSYDDSQSYIDFEYDSIEVVLITHNDYVIVYDSLFSGDGDQAVMEATDLTLYDLDTDGHVINIQKDYFVHKNSEYSTVDDVVYFIGNGEVEKEIKLIRPYSCNINTIFESTLSDGSRLPDFLDFNEKKATYTINSYDNSDQGSYQILFKETVKLDKDVVDTSLVWNLHLLDFGVIPGSVEPPYFTVDLDDINVTESSVVIKTLSNYQSSTGNPVSILYDFGSASHFTSLSSISQLYIAPKKGDQGQYLISLSLEDSDLKVRSPTYSFYINVLPAADTLAETQTSELEQFVDLPESIYELLAGNFEIYENSTKNLQAELQDVTNFGQIDIKFSKKIKQVENETEFSNSIHRILNLSIYQVDYSSSTTEEYTAFNWSFQSLSSSSLVLHVAFHDPLEIKPTEDVRFSFTVQFLIKQFFVTEELPLSFLSTEQLEKKDVLPYQLKQNWFSETFQSSSKAIASTTSVVIFSNLALNVAMSTQLSYVWGFINVLQLIIHLPLLTEYVPSNAQYFFKLLIGITNFDLIPYENLEAKMFDFNISTPLNLLFEDYGYESLNFIENLQSIFYYMMILIAILLVFAILKQLVIHRTNKLLSFVQSKLYFVLTLGFYIKFIMECYLELTLCSFVTFYQDKPVNASQRFSQVLSIIFCVLTSLFPFVISAILYKYRHRLEEEKVENQIGTVYEDHRTDSMVYTFNVIIFIARRLQFSLQAVFQDTFQINIFFLSSSLILIYLFYFKPYQIRKLNNLEIFNEMCIGACCLLLVMCQDNNQTTQKRYSIGWVLIGVCVGNIALNNVVMCLETIWNVRILYRKLKQKCRKRVRSNQVMAETTKAERGSENSMRNLRLGDTFNRSQMKDFQFDFSHNVQQEGPMEEMKVEEIKEEEIKEEEEEKEGMQFSSSQNVKRIRRETFWEEASPERDNLWTLQNFAVSYPTKT